MAKQQKDHVKEPQGKKKQIIYKEVFHLLFYSPDGYNDQCEASSKPKVRGFVWVAGTQTLGKMFPQAISRELNQKWSI